MATYFRDELGKSEFVPPQVPDKYQFDGRLNSYIPIYIVILTLLKEIAKIVEKSNFDKNFQKFSKNY